jgi:hypothetical protein
LSPLSILVLLTAATRSSIPRRVTPSPEGTGRENRTTYRQQRLMAIQHRLYDSCLTCVHHHRFTCPLPPIRTRWPWGLLFATPVLSLLGESSGGGMVRKSSFDSEGYLPGSVLTFVAIIDPHTSTATTCSSSPKFFSGHAENGTTYLTPIAP